MEYKCPDLIEELGTITDISLQTCYNLFNIKLQSIAILHIPHASMIIPPEIRRSFLLSDKELETELIGITDSYADKLFNCDQATKIIFPVSRLVADPERFADDTSEPMPKFGMGAIYTKTSGGQSLRATFTDDHRQALVWKYYYPLHKELTDIVSKMLTEYWRCLIIDCHSFPAVPFDYEEDKQPRPDICIDTDSYHTPEWLKDLLCGSFVEAGFSVRINSAFLGSTVPQEYYHANEMVYSIMVEINRSLYMDEITGKRNSQFKHIQGIIKLVLLNLMEQVL